MPKFRKKPIVIDAEQWFPGKAIDGVADYSNAVSHAGDYGIIQTLEGPMRCSPGDWIITGVNGEKRACKPDVFEKTYDPVDTVSGCRLCGCTTLSFICDKCKEYGDLP